MEYLNKLKTFLFENNAKYELLHLDKSVATCLEAAKQIGEDVDNLVKSIVFYKGKLVIVAIVRKNDRVDKSKISQLLKLTGIKLCSADETLEKTGYPAGGVPPLGFEATFIMDKKVSNKEEVIAGGGNRYTLIKIKTQELRKFNHAIIADIRKE